MSRIYCEYSGKIIYNHKREAIAAASNVNSRKGKAPTQAFKCEHCGGYHIGRETYRAKRIRLFRRGMGLSHTHRVNIDKGDNESHHAV